MSFLDTARKGQRARSAIQSVTGSAYGGGYGLGSRLYGYGAEGLDFNKEAGARWDNSIVYPILSLLCTTLGSVPIITGRIKDASQQVTSANVDPIPNHPITLLLEQPTPWYSGALLETGAIFQEASHGNSYAYKHRSAGGKLIGIELLPHGSCFPYTIPGSGDWISYYAIMTASGYTREEPENVLHMRWMTSHPQWLQIGLSPLEACLPDLSGDKLAARHEAVLLRNSAVGSIMAAPKPFKTADDEFQLDLSDTQAEQIQRRIDARLTGDSKGSSFVWNVPMEWKQLGFDPTQLALNETRKMSESRISAAFNMPAVVVNLLVGLEKANNRASYAGAVDQFFDACAIPYMRHRARQISEDLIPELGNEGEAVVYDESKISALKARLVRQLMDETGGPLLTPNEGRAELGLERVEGGDTLRSSQAAQPPSQQKAAEDDPDDTRKQERDTVDNDYEGEEPPEE